ncbi:DUF4082 domain-containing protein [Emticicia sp. TH156]|uniref:DUF4082 domain-containing protein n=1 Tax=Emticicia sp. TH156 TaxID=2067454 RepID=UPI000C784BD7|nr:DUF4082 domain-containing protein [Emticicia sp. TH156]PLK45603.1 hypothetical protein C0V77_05600 [Emticicia sp. TH156]
MKKQFFVLLANMLLIFIIIGCKKKEIHSEEAFTSFLADSTMNIKVTTNLSSYYEFGLKFQTLVEGRIVKLGTILPNAGEYRVCVWDFSNKSVLLQQNVIQNQANKLAWVNVSSLPLVVGKDYFISVLANNWNDAYPKSGRIIPYPLVKGNIKILGFAYKSQPSSIAPPVLPNEIDNNFSISGFVDFGFVPK